MSWSFAIINGKLSEIYFDRVGRGIKFRGHCYVEKSEYKSKQELGWMKKEIQKNKFSYRNGIYDRIISA